MGTFVLRRFLQSVPQMFIISLLLFVLIMNTGDPISTLSGRNRPLSQADRARLRARLGLDQPWYMQYVYWLAGNDWTKVDTNGDGVPDSYGERKGVLRGDLGYSFVTRQTVVDVIAEKLPNTLLLMGSAEVLIIVLALIIGIYSALRPYSLTDNVITAASFVGFSMPVFMTALMLMYVFAVYFKRWGLPYLPTVGMFDPQVGNTPAEVARHMVLPLATLTIISLATYNRYVRSSMLEVINADYIRTARAKGLHERAVLFGHALKNASLPLVTLIGLDLPFMLAGAVVTERIFAWPGTGQLFIDSIGRADVPVLMGVLMMIAVAVVVFQILTDVVYTFLDPRIRLE